MGLQLVIVSPEQTVFKGEIEKVELPGTKGRFEVLVNHAPLVSTLTAGRIAYCDSQGKEQVLVISGGFVEINANVVSVCVELE